MNVDPRRPLTSAARSRRCLPTPARPSCQVPLSRPPGPGARPVAPFSPCGPGAPCGPGTGVGTCTTVGGGLVFSQPIKPAADNPARTNNAYFMVVSFRWVVSRVAGAAHLRAQTAATSRAPCSAMRDAVQEKADLGRNVTLIGFDLRPVFLVAGNGQPRRFAASSKSSRSSSDRRTEAAGAPERVRVADLLAWCNLFMTGSSRSSGFARIVQYPRARRRCETV